MSFAKVIFPRWMTAACGCGLLLAATFVGGCFGIADSFAGYDVSGTIIDAATSAPLADGTVTIDLLRDGKSILNEPDLGTNVGTDGGFDNSTLVDVFEQLVIFPIPIGLPPGRAELGDPPDHVMLLVRTVDRAGVALIALEPQDIAAGGELGRRIDLAEVVVELQDAVQVNP